MFDRYQYDRTIEDLKERYYSVVRKILLVRDDKTHPLYNYRYDSEYQR